METFTSIPVLLEHFNVSSYKETTEGFIAIHKHGFWLYFSFKGNTYIQVGSSLRFEFA